MDICDQSDQQNEILHKYAVASARKPEGPKANGRCLFCNEPLGEGMRFCDSDCAKDFERFSK